jgi:hypothetical protein
MKLSLKLLSRGLDLLWDENTYTSVWIAPDLMALYTASDSHITKIFMNENQFPPSSWRRSLIRDTPNSKGTNVDGYICGIDTYPELILENCGPPLCTKESKKSDDEAKCWRNSADSLIQRFYKSTGSFEVAKQYRVMSMIVYGMIYRCI